jgi:transcription initiation factor IIF auxiliary subunit
MAFEALHLEQSEQYVGNGRDDHYWSWSIWLEGPEAELDGVDYVEYTLHRTFYKPVRRIKDRQTKFKLNTYGWGTFTIYAKAFTKEGGVVPLQHDLELHVPSGNQISRER